MKLKKLLQGIDTAEVSGKEDIEIAGISQNSRQVRKNYLFVAVEGEKTDGHLFIDDAIGNGAVAIVCQQCDSHLRGATKIVVPDTRAALAALAANFYENPSKKICVIGITGTNGKTTVAYLCRNIMIHSGYKTGLIGTIEYKIDSRTIPAQRTTPDPILLQSLLKQMKDNYCSRAVMEVSSHALHQKRVDGIDFDIGVFTNLTRDHLDYHGDMQSYLNVKASLFSKLRIKDANLFPKCAVINIDDPASDFIMQTTKVPVITFATENNADITATDLKLGCQQSAFVARTPKGNVKIKTTLLGRHNISNILAAVGVGMSQELKLSDIATAIEATKYVPGRLEFIQNNRGYNIVVDYAHTDDALKNVIITLREITDGRIITVFGCGGDRDAGKRSKMGRVANSLADFSVVTSDNPRSEDPDKIVFQIVQGFDGNKNNFVTIADRKKAIAYALDKATEGDTILIAGKGHETYQEFKNNTIMFDDREVVRELMKWNPSVSKKS